MSGLSPEDPRFERAVAHGLDCFKTNRWLRAVDREDLAQEIRIALLDHGGAAPKMCARYAALDWWRREWGRKREGKMTSRGWRYMEALARNPVPVDGDTEGFIARLVNHVDRTLDGLQSREPAPDSGLLLQEMLQALEECSPRNRALLTLRYFHDCTLREIGERLGLSESRGCQLLPYAEAELRRVWKRRGLGRLREAA